MHSSWEVYRLYQDIDSRYVKGTIDAALDSPLVVTLGSLTPKEEEGSCYYIEQFNERNKDRIQKALEIRRIHAQQELAQGYNQIKKELEPIPQKKINSNH